MPLRARSRHTENRVKTKICERMLLLPLVLLGAVRILFRVE